MIILWIFVICALFYIYSSVIELGFGQCRCSQHLVGKVAVITGSNIRIGFANAKDFTARRAKVILACRNEERGLKSRDDIISATGNHEVHFYKLDLSSFASIRDFVNKFVERRLDILVNNAGDLDLPITITEDGVLLGMQVNYFGPFLLTNLLLPILKKSAPIKNLNVASTAYKLGNVNLDNLNDGKDGLIGHMKIYANAKLCTILATQKLAKKLESTGVTVNALCPGFVATNIFNKVRFSLWRHLLNLKAYLQAKDCYEGAQTQIFLSVSLEVKDISGCYFTDCKKRQLESFAKDSDLARKLCEVTDRLVNLK